MRTTLVQATVENLPPVHHTLSVPLILVGHGSSGTSITSALLRRYLGVSFGTESQFIPRFARRLHQYGDLNDDANCRRLVRHLLKERWFERCRKFGFSTTEEAVMRDLRERSLRGVCDAVFSQFARHNHAQRWGDKTPEYTHHLPLIHGLFPDAQYLHVVRDGRDVALSIFSKGWGAKNVIMAALEWREAIESVQRLAAQLPAAQFHELRYEDLLSDPVAAVDRLVEFLRIDDASGALREVLHENLPRELKSSNFDKWKKSFSARQQCAFDGVAGDLLSRYGYETRSTAARNVGPLERLWWRACSRLGQYCHADYWQDNLYKLKVRTRDLMWRLG
jgi:hypothetical protein